MYSRELPNPQLELFDLDDAFSSEKARLAQITNKCGDEDVEYFVRESADILGITSEQVRIYIWEHPTMHTSLKPNSTIKSHDGRKGEHFCNCDGISNHLQLALSNW